MKTRFILIVAAAMMLALAVAASAGAKPKPKPAITPTLGEYAGTAKLPNGKTELATGKVEKISGALYLDPVVSALNTCANEAEYPGDAGFLAPLKAPKYTYTGTDKHLEPIIGTEANYKESFKFTSSTAVSASPVNAPVRSSSA